MADYKKQVFEMLGVEPDEEFRLYDNEKNVYFDGTYKLDEHLYVLRKSENEWESFYAQLVNIINGYCRIERIRKPTEDDIIVLKYGKLCGFKWVAKDNEASWFFKDKPVKNEYEWCVEDDIMKCIRCRYDISFLTWDDEEPINIDAILKEC